MYSSRLFLLTALAITLAACDATGPTNLAAIGPDSSLAQSSADRVAVCHVDDQGDVHRIEVSSNALDAHLGHGDGVPGGEAPGGTFDEACEVVEAAPFSCQVIRYESENGTPLVSIEFYPTVPADYDLRAAGFTVLSGTPDSDPIVAIPLDSDLNRIGVRLIFQPSTDGPAVVTVDVPTADGTSVDSCGPVTVD